MADGDTNAVNEEEKQQNNSKRQPTPASWKPGQSGNPNGRPPKGHSITETIRAMMDEKPEIKKALGAKILKMALDEGDMAAIRLLWNYLDGMPVQVNELMGKDGEPIQGLVIVKNGDTSK